MISYDFLWSPCQKVVHRAPEHVPEWVFLLQPCLSLATYRTGILLVNHLENYWKSCENHMNIIGNICAIVWYCLGHLYGAIMRIISLKAAGNYSASIWSNIFRFVYGSDRDSSFLWIRDFWTCPWATKPKRIKKNPWNILKQMTLASDPKQWVLRWFWMRDHQYSLRDHQYGCRGGNRFVKGGIQKFDWKGN